LEHLKKKLGIPSEKFLIDIEDSGNTVSSTITILIAKKGNQDINFLKIKLLCLSGLVWATPGGAVILKM
jgi:3-oxoacyl-[acyl-carrier-protein] synthase III